MAGKTDDEAAIMEQVHREVYALESEYDGLRHALQQRTDELKNLKAGKASRRRAMRGTGARGGDGTVTMSELMTEMKTIQVDVHEKTESVMKLQRAIDRSKLETLQLEASEAAMQDEVRENQEAMQRESMKNDDLSSKLRGLESDLDTLDAQITEGGAVHERANASLRDAHSRASVHDEHQVLAVNLEQVEMLMTVLPHLDQDLAEAEEIFYDRNGNLRARMTERDSLQHLLDGLAPSSSTTDHSGLRRRYHDNPQANYEMLREEIRLVQIEQEKVEAAAERRRAMELDAMKRKQVAESESRRLRSEIESLRRRVEERDQQIAELSKKLDSLREQTDTMEHSIVVTEEKLLEVDNIEEWRLRMLLRKLEIKHMMRNKEKAELAKIVDKARRIKQDEFDRLEERVMQRTREINALCDVKQLVKKGSSWTPPTAWSSKAGTETTTTTTTEASKDGRAVGSVTRTDYSTSGANTTQHTDVGRSSSRRAAGGGGAAYKGSERETRTSTRETTSSRSAGGGGLAVDGDTINTLASHSNPNVRAAALRVQQMMASS